MHAFGVDRDVVRIYRVVVVHRSHSVCVSRSGDAVRSGAGGIVSQSGNFGERRELRDHSRESR